MAQIIIPVEAFGGVLDHEMGGIIFGNVLWMMGRKLAHRLPQCRYRVDCGINLILQFQKLIPNSYNDMTNPYFLLFSLINLNGS